MDTYNEEWYSLPTEESGQQAPRPDSVVSDVCEGGSGAATYLELSAEQSEEGGSDVSDVLSPDRRRATALRYRAEPVGGSEGISDLYRQRGVTGQEDSPRAGHMDTSLGQQSIDDVALNLSHDALQAAILDLSQHEYDPSLMQESSPQRNTNNIKDNKYTSKTLNSISEQSSSHLTQNTFGETSSFKTSDSSDFCSQGISLSLTNMADSSVEPSRLSGDLTQHPSVEPMSSEPGTRSSTESEILFMAQSSEKFRPGTVIRRPLTEGHNQMDSIPGLTGNKPAETTTTQNQAQAPIVVGNVHDYTQSSQFDDHSIKYGHGHNPRETLGDTLLYTDKQPVVSSTPGQDRTGKVPGASEKSTITSQSLQKTLQNLAAGAQDSGTTSGSDSNTNIAKFMKKAGVDDYITASERQNIMDDLIGLKSSEISVDTRTKSPVLRGTPKSPGGGISYHEMIPDTPSFRPDDLPDIVKQQRSGSPGQRSEGSQRSRTSEGDSARQSLEQFTLEESSMARPGSSLSSEGSSNVTGKSQPDIGLGLSRERTSYDLFGSDGEKQKPQEAAAGEGHSASLLDGDRSECSSLGSLPGPAQSASRHRGQSGSSTDTRDEPQQYRSSDTLLGYDYRDAAASQASSETPRSVTSHQGTTEVKAGDQNNMAAKDQPQMESLDDGMSDKSSGSQRSQGSRHSYESSSKCSTGSVVLASSLPSQPEASKETKTKSDKVERESEGGIPKRGPTEGKESPKRAKSPSKPSQIPRLSLQPGKKDSATYKDEKWASKATGVLDSVAKRQSLSARVATILATAPPTSQKSGNNTSSERSTPVSRLSSSQGLDNSKIISGSTTPKQGEDDNVSTGVSDMLTPRTDEPELTPRTEDFMLAKEAEAVERLLQMSKQTAPSVSSTDEDRKVSSYSEMMKSKQQQQEQIGGRDGMDRSPATTASEDEDVERITGEYKSILKGVTAAVETGQDINVLRAKLTNKEDERFRSSDGIAKRSEARLSKDAQELLGYKEVQATKQKKNEDIEGAGSVMSDASLDEDVKRILAKYGHKVEQEEEKGEGHVVTSSRQSPAGSAYETDDTLTHRVQQLLKKPEPRKPELGGIQGYQINGDPLARSLEVDKTDSLCPTGLGSLQQRIDEVAKYGNDRKKTGEKGMLDGGRGATQSVSDTLNERVRNMLADDEDDEEDATSRQVSSFGSRSQSRGSSVDYRHLEKDLDEIQSNLESLKGDVSSTRRSSDVSERSAELRKFMESKGEDETLKKTREVLEEQENANILDQYDRPRVLEGEGHFNRRRLEPEGHGRSPPPRTSKLPLSPILTSGVIPMDVALDMIHGDPYSKYNGVYGSSVSPSSYSNRTMDTETLLRDAGYQEGGFSDPAASSRDDSGHRIWTSGNSALAGVAPGKMESLTDREVREINGVENDTTMDSYSGEKVGQSTDSEQKQGELDHQPHSPPSVQYPAAAKSAGHLDISTGSPVTAKPFSAYGNMQHLLESHMNKFSSTKFEESPGKSQAGERWTEESVGAVTGDRVSSPHDSRGSTLSPRDGAASRGSSHGSRGSLTNLRPYRPPGSREVYYVETGLDPQDGMSETTVESTHPGSDDALGPPLPPQAYGTRRDPQKGGVVMYSKEQAMSTIQEQSLIHDPADAERHSVQSSRPSRGSGTLSSGATPKPAAAASSSSGNRELSVNKAHDWVNGHWPSREDVSAPSRVGDNRAEQREQEARYSRSSAPSSDDKLTGSQPADRPRREWEGVTVETHDEYSRKCKNLQTRYKDLKARAEEAIDKLIRSESEDSFRSEPDRRDDRRHGREGRRPGTEDRRHGTDDRRHDTEDMMHGTEGRRHGKEERRHGTEDGRHGTEDIMQGTEDRRYDTDDRMHGTNNRRHDTDDRRRGTEERRHDTEDRRHGADDRMRGTNDRMRDIEDKDWGRSSSSKKERSKKAEFSTPHKLGTSRLSLERSLNDTGRLSLGGDRSTGSDISRSSSVASGRESSHEFMKYHSVPEAKISGTDARTSNNPGNGYRGPAYWSSVVQQNYSEMAKPKTPTGELVSHDQEIRDIQRMETERAARLTGGRRSPVGMGRSERVHTPDLFQPLEPDQDDYNSPHKPTKSHSQVTRSTSPHHRSPERRSGSPYGRSESPDQRSGSPYGRSGSPHQRSGSPYERSDRMHHDAHDRLREHEEEKVYHRSGSPPQDRRSTRGDSPVYGWISPERSGSPAYHRGRSPVLQASMGKGDDVRGQSGSPDIQDMWERFQGMQVSDTSRSSPVNIDLDKLSNLLQNPVQHMVRNMQQGSHFDQGQEERGRERSHGGRDRKDRSQDKGSSSPVRLNQGRSEVTGSPDRQNRGDRGHREHREERRGHNGTSQDQRSSGGHRRGEEDDRDDRRRGNGDDRQKRKHFDHADVADESEETILDETEEDEAAVGGRRVLYEGEPQQKRKMAWVIKDEELHSIPENSTLDSISSDFTTSSEMDSDGKMVTKTTKRNLPGDPKLLRLQQKITKQKEKYKRELSRERKRKEKIAQLEALFRQQKAKKSIEREERTADASMGTTTTCKTTSTPSSERHRADDTTLGVSNITSTSTLTQGTVVSEDLTLVTTEVSGEFERSLDDKHPQQHHDESDNSSVCHCCHKRKPALSRSVSPPKRHPAVQERRNDAKSHSASPARRQRTKSKEKVTEQPKGLKLREVDYNKLDVSGKEERRSSRKAVYLEIEKPQSQGVPKTKKAKVKTAMSPSKRKEKENNENMRLRRDEEEGLRSSQGHWTRSTTRKQRQLESERSDMGVQMTPKAKTRDFGATCPTPLIVSPPMERGVRKVTMVSESVQTEHGTKRSKTSDGKQSRGRDHSPGMFTPEQSDSDVSLTLKQRSHNKRPVQAAQEGVSWFVPMKEPRPWRKPLRERQANAVAMETWPQMDEFTRRKLEELTLGPGTRNKSLELAGLGGEKEKGDLQSHFEKKMDAFISASRERQKHIALRAEERKISEIHRSERATLFRVDRKKEANLDALPISDMHYKPRKRFMTKHEMRELTKKKYAKLPEVTQRQQDKKREEAYKTNRLRAQMFKQRVQSKVLQQRTPALHMP